MNAERLRAVVDSLLEIEKRSNIQNALEELSKALSEMSANSTPETQTQVAKRFDELDNAIVKGVGEFSPAQKSSISAVNAQQYFGRHMIDHVKDMMTANAMTPAIVLQKVQELIEERKSYLNILRNTRAGLRNLGIEPTKIQPGEAEISVLIPRNLFHNDLEGLQKELKTISSIIRTFYEISNVTPGQIKVLEISTSDPTFFLGIDVAPLVAIGLAIKWAIDVIKGSHDIKKIADSARKAEVDEEIIKKIEENIHKKVDQQIEQRVQDCLEKFRGDAARKNELEKPTRNALEQLVQRIERGMVIEIRSTPPQIDVESDPDAASRLAEQFEELHRIAASLDYPIIEGEPVLQLAGEEAASHIPAAKQDLTKPSEQ